MTRDGMESKLKSNLDRKSSKDSTNLGQFALTRTNLQKTALNALGALLLALFVFKIEGALLTLDTLLLCSMGSFLFGNSTRENRKNDQKERLAKSRARGKGFEKESAGSELEPLTQQVNWSLFSNLNLPGEKAAYSLHNGEGTFIEITEKCGAVWGLTKDQILGKSLSKIVKDGNAIIEWLVSLDKESHPDPYPIELGESGSADGSLNLKAIPLFISSDPEKTQIVVKAAPRFDKPTQEPFPQNQTFSSIHALNGDFISIDSQWEDCLGLGREAIKGKAFIDLVLAEERESAIAFFQQIQDSVQPAHKVFRFRDSREKTRSLLVSAQLDSDSRSIILEAKNLTLETGVDLLKASVELIHESVVILMKEESEYRICFVNQAFEEMTGYSSSHVSGNTLSCLNGDETSEEAFGQFEEAIDKNNEHETELLLYRKDGASFWSKTHLCPLRDSQDKADYFVVILEDATEVKNYAEELADKNSELEEALQDLKETQKAVIQQENLRALGQMASGIAHDFNNLLAPILGFSELLLNVPANAQDEEKLKSYLRKIQVAAQDGAAVVSRLREFYRSQNNSNEYVKIKPEDLIWQVKELTKHRWKNQAEANGISINFNTKLESGNCIKANESEIRQVLTNLVINAVDAITSSGDISIEVKDYEDKVRISVSDTGSGMPEDIQKNCLEPFYTTKGKLGTGLGLSIVFGVVKRHNGEFQIESEEGKGTRIIMDFPAFEPDQEEDAQETENLCSNSLKIMLVDDEEVLLEVISELLSNGGHNVDNFSDPKAALQAFEKGDYDLVITDRAMPGMSGDQLATEIKSIRSTTPVYMVTGFGDVIKESGEELSDVDEVLGKPVPLDVLNRKISELVAGRN